MTIPATRTEIVVIYLAYIGLLCEIGYAFVYRPDIVLVAIGAFFVGLLTYGPPSIYVQRGDDIGEKA